MDKKKLNFTVKNLLTLVLLVSLAVAWYSARRELAACKATIKVERKKYYRLDLQNPNNIAAIQIPALFSRKLWQWRVHVPETGKFKIKAAYNDLLPLRAPSQTESKIDLHLPPGESIVTVLVDKIDGKWTLVVGRHREEDTVTASETVICKETDWIDNRAYGATAAGKRGTEENDSNEPMVLIQLRDSNYDANGKPAPFNNPSLGIMAWIEKTKPN